MRLAGSEALHAPVVRALLAGAAVGVIGAVAGAELAVVVLVAGAAAVITHEVSSAFHVLQRRARSAEAHGSLLALMGRDGLPPLFGGWAVEADFARILLEELARRRPRAVVELGSGVSTLVIASALRAHGSGKLYSLEHEASMADQTRALLADRGLDDVVEVVTAPLARQTFGTDAVEWYDTGDRLDEIGPVDLVVVDGPPPVGPLSRWPALEVLYPKLAPHACVLMDDGRRRSERRTAFRWARSFPDLDLYWIDTVKGTWMLCRRPHLATPSPVVTAVRRLRRVLHPRPPGFEHWPILR
jgi:predicted O-methyltransferase YrrM